MEESIFNWIDVLYSIGSGIVSGLVASIIFFTFLSRLRPSITICEDICKFERDGIVYYAFKIYNDSNRFSVLDVRVEAMVRTPFNTDGGKNYKIERLSLKSASYMVLPKYKKSDESMSCALVLTTEDNIDELWKSESQNIIIKVYGRHSLSGAFKSFEKVYWRKSTSIKSGFFVHGRRQGVN